MQPGRHRWGALGRGCIPGQAGNARGPDVKHRHGARLPRAVSIGMSFTPKKRPQRWSEAGAIRTVRSDRNGPSGSFEAIVQKKVLGFDLAQTAHTF